MSLQHRHPRSCFSCIITHNNHNNTLSSIQRFPLSALLSIHIQAISPTTRSTAILIRNISQSATNLDIDINNTVRQRFSVSLLYNQTPFLFHPSSLSISFSSKSSAMGRVCLGKMQCNLEDQVLTFNLQGGYN